MNFKNLSFSLCLTTGLLLSFSISAHAITANLSPTGTTGPGGVTNQGTFSSEPDVTTIDFNAISTPKPGTYSYGSGVNRVTYSGINGSTSVASGTYAPPGPSGQTNVGKYLAVFPGSDVTISFDTPKTYFGMNWGFADRNNLILFYTNASDTNAAKTFRASDIPLRTDTPQQSAYVNFFSNNSTDSFSKIIISNTGAGSAFETDNHSFKYVPFGFSPGLGIAGLGAWGAIVQFKRRWQEEKSIKKPALAE